MGAGSNAPVIIKRKKVVAAEVHHGGAWKVAYADFVTAMMAFFMLMWLLNATTEKQRKGIADYFNPTIPINRVSGGGDGSFSGDSMFAEDVLARNGTGAMHRMPGLERQARGSTGTDAAAAEAGPGDRALAELENRLTGRSGESLLDDGLLRHVVTRLTDEGLIVEVFDLDDAPLFAPDGDAPTPTFRAIVEVVAGLFATVANDIAVAGHVRSRPIVLAANPVWELSTARAQATRLELESGGIVPARLKRVTGHADRAPAARAPMAVRNNRVELILLRSDL
ncbi:chemotaxis protein MotB [Rhodovulum iodosum]|uniref:Chemotaxis protein MotB n=1 Tax=Rhodovulum iodosum TaxID=68291 RepID=A0ABV3XU47_9RHOB|nr:flagellar motor protein MotB [Rhodovulum robiginosum]RSK30285.1 chemotaxis protein MotB [Rhodovulum robiginosum]